LPAPPRARLAIAAAVVVAAGAAFGIGYVVASPDGTSSAAEPLRTVAAPELDPFPGLRGDLAALPGLAPAPASPSSGRGSGGTARPSGSSTPTRPTPPADEGTGVVISQ
jgi:hypothetical protein